MRSIPRNYRELEKLLARKIEVYKNDPELLPLYETLVSKKAIANRQYSHETMGKTLSSFGVETLDSNVREALVELEEKYAVLYKNSDDTIYVV